MVLAAFCLSGTAFMACNNDDDYDNSVNYPNALVTIKTNTATGQVYLQLDDATTVLPTNMKTSRYGNRELRALANLTMQEGQPGHYSKTAFVNWMDTILTKKMSPDLGAKNDQTYGTDPLEIVKHWTTVVEDGYLTLRFRTYFGNRTKHVVTLVKGANPYEVVLHHDAKGDVRGVVKDGLVAFRLSDLPDTHGKAVDLTLKWKSFSGVKSVTFKYTSRP
ncbi:NigD-like protein [Segatella oulorum]|uniref:NigD-like protein n=1 Tax=Segatella oulorum TaxID=28136 RepID=UPI0028E4638A|nr:NigD-like protein [Segatella oulorum]